MNIIQGTITISDAIVCIVDTIASAGAQLGFTLEQSLEEETLRLEQSLEEETLQ